MLTLDGLQANLKTIDEKGVESSAFSEPPPEISLWIEDTCESHEEKAQQNGSLSCRVD